MEFQKRLEGIAALLRLRKLDVELHIEIRDPKDFDLPYLLDIINKVEEQKEKKSSYTRFVRKCLRKSQENQVVLEGILGLIPGDIYGSLISGGFTLILAVSTNP